MTIGTKIEWADDTVNFWMGCTQVSPACDFCYAKEIAERFGLVEWNGPPKKVESAVATIARIDRKAKREGRIRFVFINSMSDIFDNRADPSWRREAFDAIRKATNVVALLLTKRIGNARRMIEEAGGLPANAALGATFCNQDEVDRDMWKLLEFGEALFRFGSFEPLLGPIDLTKIRFGADSNMNALGPGGLFGEGPWLDWIIVGGESGAKARPIHVDWVRALRDQAFAYGRAFFYKQHGAWTTVWERAKDPDDRQCPGQPRNRRERYLNLAGGQGFHGERVTFVRKVGKAAAGRELDGRFHDARPALRFPKHSGGPVALKRTDDRIITAERAEQLMGRRLDRRRRYAEIDGEVCERVEWTHSCSGCTELGDYGGGSEHYPSHPKHGCLVGAGCDECGYRGVRRNETWVPVTSADVGRAVEAELAEGRA